MPVAVPPQFQQTQTQPWRALPVTYPATTPTADSPATAAASPSGRGWVVGAIGWGGPDLCLQDDYGGLSWTRYAGTWSVVSGLLHNDTFSNWSVGGSASTTNGPDPMGSDQFIARDRGKTDMDLTVTVVHADSATAWLALNFDPTTRGAYLFEVGPLTHRVFRSPDNSASRTLLATPAITVTSPGSTVIRFKHDGAGNFDVWQDGTHITSFTDASPLTGTWVGLGMTSNTSTSNGFSVFSAC